MILPRWLEQSLLRPIDNPGFAISTDEARLELARLAREPRPLQRPLVCLSGWRALELLPRNLIANLSPTVVELESNAIPVAYPRLDRIPEAAGRVVDAVDARWPSDEPHATTEVDVIGVSMGGLVARAAALGMGTGGNAGAGRRLRIARLFTVGTPHQGARLAEDHPVDRAARDMLPGSAFLAALDAGRHEHPFEMVCYARLHDEFVGATRCAPPGEGVHWVSGLRILSHLTIGQDPRILADLARRLRGEPPLTSVATDPPSD